MTGGKGAGQALGAGAGASEHRAQARGTGRRAAGAAGAQAAGAQALGCAGRAGTARVRAEREAGAQQGRHRRAGRGSWACRWPTGCALGALSLFLARFDSVLFLSQFLDIVREPGS